MNGQGDHYRTLGVHPSSEDIVIQAAYKALMRRYHPDTNRDPDAVAKAQAINEAYNILSNKTARAAYDRSRAQSSRTSGQSPPPPPPPGEKATADPARPNAPPEMRNGKGVFLAFGAIAAICVLLAISVNLPESAAADTTLNVDETLTTENVTADTGLWGDTVSQIDANAVGGYEETNLAVGPLDFPRATLATAPQVSVKFDNIESASRRFTAILSDTGMDGARTFSTECHRKVVENPSWSGADFCAAFDYAAAHVDKLMSRASGWAVNQYFQFQQENQEDNYADAGASRYLVGSRLNSIRRAAEASATEAVGRLLQEREAARKSDIAPEQVASASRSSRSRVVPQGVYLNQEERLGDGTKRCVFGNGLVRVIAESDDCWTQ